VRQPASRAGRSRPPGGSCRFDRSGLADPARGAGGVVRPEEAGNGRLMRQPSRYLLIADRRAIIDRRALGERLAALPDTDLQAEAGKLLRAALDAGRAEIARRLALEPGRGRVI